MLLTILFNAIFKCGYVPDSFGLGVIITIPKGENKKISKTFSDLEA